jgi:hypothetical protein
MTQEPSQHTCPWCAYAVERLKMVLLHMESQHQQQWLNLVLYPPIAGGVY